MIAMLLAAGRGERLRPLTDRTPKPLVEVAGYSLLDYHLRALAAADVRRVIINTSWLAGQIHAAVGDGSQYGLEVLYSDEGSTALETGGGVARALEFLGDDPFLVINGDVWTDYPYADLAAPGGMDLARVVMVANPAHNPGGDFCVHEGRLRLAGTRTLTFAGVGIYHRDFFLERSRRFSLAQPLREFAAADRVAAVEFDGQWWDVGTLDRLRALDAWLKGAGATGDTSHS